MTYIFSWTSFFVGFVILAVSVMVVLYHQKISDAMGSGAASYDRYKLWALAGCGLGFVVMFNLHSLILTALVQAIFPAMK